MAPRLYTLTEAAGIFRVSRRVFAEYISDKPFYRTLGKAKLFTDQDLSQLYEALNCPSNSNSGPTPKTGTCAEPSEASESARLAALMTKPRRKPSRRGANGKSCGDDDPGRPGDDPTAIQEGA